MDTVRRAFDNVLANWPLLLIRVAESVVMMVVILAGILAAAVPVIISVATGGWDVEALDKVQPDEIAGLLLAKWWLIGWVIIALTIVILAAVAIHSFFQAGSMGVYLDGERLAGTAQAQPPRQTFRAFAPDRWFAFGRRFWWPVFLIYNITWGLFGIVLIIPLVVLLIAVIMYQDNPAVAMIGCVGVFVIFLLLLVGGLVITVWTDLAIAESVRTGEDARTSLGRGGYLLRKYLGDVIIVVAVLTAFSIAVMMVMFTAYIIIGLLSAIPGVSVLLIPAQIALSLVQNAISMFIAGWFLAAFAAVAMKAQGVADVR